MNKSGSVRKNLLHLVRGIPYYVLMALNLSGFKLKEEINYLQFTIAW